VSFFPVVMTFRSSDKDAQSLRRTEQEPCRRPPPTIP
jgi:hypothetical protein